MDITPYLTIQFNLQRVESHRIHDAINPFEHNIALTSYIMNFQQLNEEYLNNRTSDN